jgi:hypothetical protein
MSGSRLPAAADRADAIAKLGERRHQVPIAQARAVLVQSGAATRRTRNAKPPLSARF